jgi:hypothetical protein
MPMPTLAPTDSMLVLRTTRAWNVVAAEPCATCPREREASLLGDVD